MEELESTAQTIRTSSSNSSPSNPLLLNKGKIKNEEKGSFLVDLNQKFLTEDTFNKPKTFELSEDGLEISFREMNRSSPFSKEMVKSSFYKMKSASPQSSFLHQSPPNNKRKVRRCKLLFHSCFLLY